MVVILISVIEAVPETEPSTQNHGFYPLNDSSRGGIRKIIYIFKWGKGLSCKMKAEPLLWE